MNLQKSTYAVMATALSMLAPAAPAAQIALPAPAPVRGAVHGRAPARAPAKAPIAMPVAALPATPVAETSLPAAGARAPISDAVTMRLRMGRPTIYQGDWPANAAIIPSSAYCDSIVGWGKPEHEVRWKSWVDNFIANGVKVYHIELGRYHGDYGKSSFWTDEGVYADTPSDEPFTADARINYILSKVPDARFIIRLGAYAPAAWIDKNPGEMQADDKGKIFEPSLASEKFLTGIREFYHRVVRYYESQTWSSHVLGYMVIPYGEGITPCTIEGNFFDHSPRMQLTWRQFLTKKYDSDEALQAAWKDPAAQRATAVLPTENVFRTKIEALPHWPAAADMRLERDYSELQRQLFMRWVTTLTGAVHEAVKRPVLIGIDSMKQPMLGWQINEAFEAKGLGTDSISLPFSAGALDVGPLLDQLPWLTNLITPADYTARSMGFAFDAEGLTDSLVLRGKTTMVENDARTYLSPEAPGHVPVLGTLMDLQQIRAGLLRNTGMALSRGLLTYWTDIGGGYYNDPKIQSQISIDHEVQVRGSLQPHRETQHAIAVIIDDTSPTYENGTTGFQNIALLHQRVDGLDACGIPYRQYMLSDLKKDNFPEYRCYLFPNLFKVDAETLALLKRKVFRDGSIAIFGPGTGITDGETVSAAGAESVLGIPMKLFTGSSSRRVRILTRSHMALAMKDMPGIYGDSYKYGPILTPDPARLPGSGTVTLGEAITTWNVSAPGLVLKEFGRGGAGNGHPGVRGDGDYAVVFSAAIPLPAPLLRSLAHYGGCNVWVDSDAVVMASDSVVTVHSTEPGLVTLNFPRRMKKVTDAVTGNVVAVGVTSLQLDITPPETRVFFTE